MRKTENRGIFARKGEKETQNKITRPLSNTISSGFLFLFFFFFFYNNNEFFQAVLP